MMGKKGNIPVEMELLLAACFLTEMSDIPSNVDYTLLKNLVRYHGIRPQFFDFLHKNKLEVSFQQSLAQDCQQIAIFNMLSVSELAKICKLQESNGIKCFAYKGSVWANWLYGNVGKREFGDIDLLIDRSSLHKALKLLASQGYHPDSYREYLLSEPERAEGFYRTDYHVPLENTSNATSSMVEVHWQVAYPRLQFHFPEEEWNKYSQTYSLHGNDFNTFVNEYQFLLLLVHHGGKEQWSRMKYIADFAGYMVRYGNETNWKLVEKLAREKGIYTLFTRSMDLLKSLGLPWSSQWPAATTTIDIHSYFQIWMLMPVQAENSTWPYFVHGLAIHDGVQHKSKVLFAHLAYLLEWRLLLDKKRWYDKNPD